MRTWSLVGLGGLLLAVLAAPALLGPSDRALIQQTMDEALRASREGRPGGVLENLSRSIRYNDMPLDNPQEVAEFIRNGRPDVTVADMSPDIQGGMATIESPVTVSLRYGPLPMTQTLPKVRFTLRKEVGTRWLVVPAPKWRLVSIEADGVAVPSY
jgi:hypothetical protein